MKSINIEHYDDGTISIVQHDGLILYHGNPKDFSIRNLRNLLIDLGFKVEIEE